MNFCPHIVSSFFRAIAFSGAYSCLAIFFLLSKLMIHLKIPIFGLCISIHFLLLSALLVSDVNFYSFFINPINSEKR